MQSIRNPITLTVQPNPTLGNRLSAMAGYTTPPVAEPVAVTAMATPLFLRKYVATNVMAGMKTKPLPNPTQNSLREEDLPISRAQRRHEEAEDLDGYADGEDEAEVARVYCTAREGADQERDEDLDRADPADSGRVHPKVFGVVRLKEAERVDKAPGVEDDEMAQYCLTPRHVSTVWRRPRVDIATLYS